MSITFYGRKLVHRAARNYLNVHASVPAGSGGSTLRGGGGAGLAVFFVDSLQKTAQGAAHTWDAEAGFLASVQVAGDAPLGPATLTFTLSRDDPKQPTETAALPVTVADNPFAAPPPALAGLPVAAPQPPANPSLAADYPSALNLWKAHLTGPIRRIYEAGVDVTEQGVWYYDGVDNALKAMRLTGDSSWLTLAQKVADAYLGLIHERQAGYESFGWGLCNLYLQTKTQKYLDAALMLANTGQFGRADSLAYSLTPDAMREVSYQLEIELALAAAGQPPLWGRVVDLADVLFLQLDQLFLSRTWAFHKPFMAGLAARALIHYLEQSPYKDARVLPYLQAAADGLTDGWLPDKATWKYTYAIPGAIQGAENVDESPSPDLNLLIAPLYAWVYSQTKDTSYRDKGDAAFLGGVNGAYYDNSHGKQASQQIYFADRYAEWHG